MKAEITNCDKLTERFIKTFATKTYTLCPETGDVKKWGGPMVKAKTFEEVQGILDSMGFGCFQVDGVLQSVIPCIPGTFEPDYSREIHYTRMDYRDN